MKSIGRLQDATSASIKASLLAVTVDDICRTLLWYTIQHCHAALGAFSGSIRVTIDLPTWTITVVYEVDASCQQSPLADFEASIQDDHELRLLSRLGLIRLTSTYPLGAAVCIWEDGRKSCSAPPSALCTLPLSHLTVTTRGVTISLHDVFYRMPERRKYISSEMLKRNQAESLTRTVRMLSPLAPSTDIHLSVRHAWSSGGAAPTSKMLLCLSRDKDGVQRCQSAFGPESVKADHICTVNVRRTFASVVMKVDGFVCLARTINAPQLIFLNGRPWPGAGSRDEPCQSERDSTVFASHLAAFHLDWTDELAPRYTPQGFLSPNLYGEVHQRTLALAGALLSQPGSSAAHTFVLKIGLSRRSEPAQGRKQMGQIPTLNVTSFKTALLDGICSKPSVTELEAVRKRERLTRPSTAIQVGARNLGSPVRSRHATASLARDSYGIDANVSEGTIEWRDPMNGRRFHIDGRTGHCIAVGPASTRASGGGTLRRSNTVRPAGRVTLMTGPELNSGFNPSALKQNAARTSTALDEFDDPALEAALASIPSPSAITSVDVSSHSRFFDSRRPDAQPIKHLLPVFRPHNTIDSLDRPSASAVELAISRADLQQATVLDQVDAKFILCSISTYASSNPLLFCIDQHAADERCRLERLLETFVTDCSGGTAAHALLSTLTLEITANHFQMIEKDDRVKDGMKWLGWAVVRAIMVHEALGHAQVDLSGVPYVLKERALRDRGTVKDQDILQSAFVNCLEELAASASRSFSITTAAGELDWLTASRAIPTALMDVIKSMSCRSAIMFNDPLSREASARLVKRLGECKFPFQCAHGRPSLVPLCEIKAQGRGDEREHH